jgi:hypothetical protein
MLAHQLRFERPERVCRLLELVVLIARGDRATELEILVLRHQLSILRGAALRAARPGCFSRC